ncbi:hypothetical protein QPK87_02060 [Kamptonema cortianum]|nr:hypothetical protein [Kamptonema cortianum]MDL5046119.1 hypothetical protein [Oscillatoria amoena NRMC-F 0135]
MQSVFRPFVIFFNEPNYRSGACNTDDIGFRFQTNALGQPIRMCNARGLPGDVDIMVGGSTVFGVDASGDDKTLCMEMTRKGRICLNLGFRGATSQQEVVGFHLLRRFLPKPRRIILFSGVNNCSLCSQSGTIFYKDFGGVFSEDIHFNWLADQYRLMEAPYSFRKAKLFLKWMEELYYESDLFRLAADGMMKLKKLRWEEQGRLRHLEKPALSFGERMELMERHLDNDLGYWSMLSRETGSRVVYVLQPAMGWSCKQMSDAERECFEADMAYIPSMKQCIAPETYDRFRNGTAELCRRHGIDFLDANEWVRNLGANTTVFTDICHLTDEGNRIVADALTGALAAKGAL